MLTNTVAVINRQGRPLMPTSPRKARKFLAAGKAKIHCHKPFTIQMLVGTPGHTQPIDLGIDAGYKHVGFSLTTDAKEIAGGELVLLEGMSDRLSERLMYRQQRRQRLRHRAPRFDNRRRPDGWLAPSIAHKKDTTLRLIEILCQVMPIRRITVELAKFDIQKIKNPEIAGVEYQQGEQAEFWNLREYILHRDQHRCQFPGCKADKDVPLQIHHLGFWKNDGSDRPGNLITLCTKCHHPRHHKKGGKLWGWEPKINTFRDATFMTTVRRQMIRDLRASPTTGSLEVQETYGHLTKSGRIALGLDKSHHNDAFVIAGGKTQKRAEATNLEQVRRNNRSLEQFYDAVYQDRRPDALRAEASSEKTKTIKTGQDTRTIPVASGQDLSSGRRRRSKVHKDNGPNLRQYRGPRIAAGRRAIRTKRHALQPGDRVLHANKRYTVLGSHNKGTRAIIKETGKSIAIEKLKLLEHRAGICVSHERRASSPR